MQSEEALPTGFFNCLSTMYSIYKNFSQFLKFLAVFYMWLHTSFLGNVLNLQYAYFYMYEQFIYLFIYFLKQFFCTSFEYV